MPVPPDADGQRPPLPRHDELGSLHAYEVCPHRKRALSRYRFWVDGVLIETWSCIEHGDVQPVRSAVRNSSKLSTRSQDKL